MRLMNTKFLASLYSWKALYVCFYFKQLTPPCFSFPRTFSHAITFEVFVDKVLSEASFTLTRAAVTGILFVMACFV